MERSKCHAVSEIHAGGFIWYHRTVEHSRVPLRACRCARAAERVPLSECGRGCAAGACGQGRAIARAAERMRRGACCCACVAGRAPETHQRTR